MNIRQIFYAFIFLIGLTACGVRGRPLPPELPPQLGRGEPSFKKATEGIQIPSRKKKETQKTSNQDIDESKSGDHP